MSAQPKKYYTPEEYLALERASHEKHEYLNGEIFTMSGARYSHTVTCMNISVALRPQLRKRGCNIVANDLRVHIPATGLYAYPDLVLVCGKPEFLDGEFDTLLNPIVIIEVLSDSTERYDRTTKFDHYRSIPSLQEYVLVAMKEPRIERFRRNKEESVRPELVMWSYQAATRLDGSITLEAVESSLLLSEVYEDIDFTNVEN
jgi:Uma2 family endonuclease